MKTNQLWIERVSTALRFDELGSALFDRSGLGPYLFILVIMFVDIPILSTLRYLETGYHPFLANPGVILIPIGLLYGIWGARRLRNQFEEAVEESVIKDGVTDRFPKTLSVPWRWLLRLGTHHGDTEVGREQLEEIISLRFKVLLLLVGWGIHLSWILLNPNALPLIIDVEGPVIGPIKFFFIIPLFYYPIGVEFIATYIGIIILLPLKIRSTGLINFQDPLDFGGLQPIGDLIQSATLYYFLGATAYILLSALPTLVGKAPVDPVIGIVTTTIIFGSIILGISLFFFPIFIIHKHMKTSKHQKLRIIAREVEEYGGDDDTMMFPETPAPNSADDAHFYTHHFIKIMKVKDTREFPIDVSHIREIIIAAFIPYIAHVTVTFLLGFAGGSH